MKNESEQLNYLQEESKRLFDLWKHTDERIEKTLNFQISSIGIIVAIATFFIQKAQDIDRALISTIPIGFISFLILGLSIIRVTNSMNLKNEYILGMNLIRGVFASKGELFKKNLILPIFEYAKEDSLPFSMPNKSIFIIFLIIFNSAIFTFSIVLTFFFLKKSVSMVLLVLIAIFTVMIISYCQYRIIKKKANNFKLLLIERLEQIKKQQIPINLPASPK